MGDSDPYKASRVSSSGETKVGANTANVRNEKVCTRCWRAGHMWKDCSAKVCSACNKPFNNATYCANWESHDKPYKWAPKHLIEEGKKLSGTKRKQDEGEDKEKAEAGLQNFKDIKRAYMAARKELKKRK